MNCKKGQLLQLRAVFWGDLRAQFGVLFLSFSPIFVSSSLSHLVCFYLSSPRQLRYLSPRLIPIPPGRRPPLPPCHPKPLLHVHSSPINTFFPAFSFPAMCFSHLSLASPSEFLCSSPRSSSPSPHSFEPFIRDH